MVNDALTWITQQFTKYPWLVVAVPIVFGSGRAAKNTYCMYHNRCHVEEDMARYTYTFFLPMGPTARAR